MSTQLIHQVNKLNVVSNLFAQNFTMKVGELKSSDGTVITKSDGTAHDAAFTVVNSNILLGTITELNETPYGDIFEVNIGFQNTLSGLLAYAHGKFHTVTGRYGHAEGYRNTVTGQMGHAEGADNEVAGDGAHAEGNANHALAKYVHVEGRYTTASGEYSHAEGYTVTASGVYAHAEGVQTKASGSYTHAEGNQTEAAGDAAHAEGYATHALGNSSHAEGFQTTANGQFSHIEGYANVTTTSAAGAHVEGHHNTTSADYQHVEGRWNADVGRGYQHVVGGGSSESNRANISTLDWSGNAWFAGKVSASQVDLTGGTVGQVLTKTASGSEWATASSGGATFIYGGTTYTGTITLGQGLKIEATGNTTTMSSAQIVTRMEFTSASLVDGILTLTNQALGTFVIANDADEAVLPGMRQSGNSVLVDLSGFTVTGTWKVYFSHGGTPSVADLTNILLNLEW